MAFAEELQILIDKRVENQFHQLAQKMEVMRPWVKINVVSERFEKNDRWVRDNFCTYKMMEKGLVKKVGGEWHFLNPEFFKYVHDVWWEEIKK